MRYRNESVTMVATSAHEPTCPDFQVSPFILEIDLGATEDFEDVVVLGVDERPLALAVLLDAILQGVDFLLSPGDFGATKLLHGAGGV